MLRAYGYPKVPPENAALSELVSRGQHFTRSIRDLVGEQFWTADKACRAHVRRLGIDDVVFSIKPMTKVEQRTIFFGVAMGRAKRCPPFDTQQQAMIHETVARCLALRPGLPERNTLGILESLRWRHFATIVGMRESLTSQQIGTMTSGSGRERGATDADDKPYYQLAKASVKKNKNKIFRAFGVDKHGLIDLLQAHERGMVATGQEPVWLDGDLEN